MCHCQLLGGSSSGARKRSEREGATWGVRERVLTAACPPLPVPQGLLCQEHSSRRRQLLCVRVVLRVELCQVPFPDAGLQQPRGVGRPLCWGGEGGFLPILSRGEAGDSLACPGYTKWRGRPHPAAQSQRLSSLLPKLLTISISQEVGDRAEGPRGQVPGQLLQLTQQAFDFCLQVLYGLLHRLE